MNALATLLQQAEDERDRALAAMRRGEDQLQRVQQQSEQLWRHRADYRQRWGDVFSRQGAIEIVHCYQSFTSRLDEALQQQAQQTETAQTQCQRLRELLTAAETRVAVVRKLIERRQADALRGMQLREQRHDDDAAQQRHWHAQAARAASTDFAPL